MTSTHGYPKHMHKPRKSPLSQAELLRVAQGRSVASREGPVTLKPAPWEKPKPTLKPGGMK